MKKFALVLLLIGVIVMSSCSGKKTESVETDKIPTLRWVQIGNRMPPNYDAWIERVNEYLVEKIGAKLEMEVISWGDWEARRAVIVNTNEDYDIIFSDQKIFANDMRIGAYADITDQIQRVAPDLYNFIPEGYWEAVSKDGRIYGVPTYKDSSFTNYIVWVKDYVDKYNIDVESITTYEAATDSLLKIKEAEGINPSILAMDAPNPAVELYDSFGSGLPTLGVAYTDTSRRVVSVFEQQDVLDTLGVLHQWYNLGIINADAATLAGAPQYMVFKVAQGWSAAAQTVWGPQMGTEAIAIQKNKTVISNNTVQGSINCINVNSPNIEKSLELLQLVNKDFWLRDAFYYGLEGEDFVYTESGRVKKINQAWDMAGYSQATFFTITQQEGVEVDQWAEVKALNEQAIPSVMLGFSFDITPVENKLANCYTIWMKYNQLLKTGAGEPNTTVALMMKEMRAAGFDDIVAEAQRQIDEYFGQ